MPNKFAYVDCFEKEKDIPLPAWTKWFGQNFRRKCILKYFPNSLDEIEYAGVEGYHIRLPIVKPIFEQDEEFVKSIIEILNGHLVNYNIVSLILDASLKPFKNDFKEIVAQGNVLGIIFMVYILEQLHLSKPKKAIKYVIIDGPSSNTEYLLDTITTNMNALTIVTNEAERYEERLEQIIEETGLAVNIQEKKIGQKIYGDLIIHANPLEEKLYYEYESGAWVIDFLSDFDAIRNMKAKRNDLHFVFDFMIKMESASLHKDQLMAVLMTNNRYIRMAYLHGYKDSMKDKFRKFLEDYPFKFELKSI